MQDTAIEASLAELESPGVSGNHHRRPQQTVTAHELEMAKMRDHMRLMTEKLKRPSRRTSPLSQKRRHRLIIEA
jgi:SlyX protein